MGAPNTQIFICDVPLTNRYDHTFFFETFDAQTDYFTSKVVKRFEDYTFVRKTGSVKVQATYEAARQWSYLFVTDYAPLAYRRYYFITDIEYINDATVELRLELDVMQTYMFRTSLTECFVEREHTANDAIGENVVDEGLDMGELVTVDKANIPMGDLCLVVVSTMNLAGIDPQNFHMIEQPATGSVMDSVFSGINFFAVDLTAANITLVNIGLNLLDAGGKSDCIIAMFMYPKKMIDIGSNQHWGDNTFPFLGIKGSKTFDATFANRPDSLGYRSMYVPRNKKLLTYPFNMLYVSNNNGTGTPFRYEVFDNPDQCVFRITGAIGADAGCKMFPVAYNGAVLNYEQGVTLPPYPMCAWNQDLYKLWVAQNQASNQASMVSAAATIVAGGATAYLSGAAGAVAGAGMIWGGLQQISSLHAQRQDRSIQPPQSKGSASGSVNVAAEHHTFTVERKTISEQFAARIDDYFDLYGYKTLRLKVPNKNHRQSWWYTKTVGCNVVGSAPTADKNKIAEIYDKGVTFWAAHDQLGNYALNNSIK